MKIKRLLLLAVMPMMCLAVNAQEKSCSKDFTPKKGDFTLAATVGYNSYARVTALPGTMDENASAEDNMGEIPGYRAVANAQTLSYSVFAGVDRYFKVKNVPNLMWYTGVRVGMAYAQNVMKYDEYETMGKSVGESWNLRGSITMGVDYFVLPAMYVGAQIDPFSYTYNMTTYKPQEGLSNLDADSHNFSLLAAPTIKIGFKF